MTASSKAPRAFAPPSRDGYLPVLLLVSSTITWRQGSYYTGGVDPVVAAKAVLGVLAAVLARRAAERCAVRQRIDGRPMLYFAVYLAISLLGALATGTTFVASAVIAVRLVLIAYTLYQLALALPADRLLLLLVGGMAIFVVSATVTGSTAGTVATGAGRLIGGIPALQPNEIGQLCGLVIIVLLWRDLHGRARIWDGPAVFALIYVVWLTGSRTTLGFLAIAVVVLLVVARRFNTGFVIAVLALVPLGFYAVFGTTVVSGYFGRGGSTDLTTFNQRTVAWSAALHVHHGFWEVWFGNGLSVVSVPVVAKFRSTQLLDSSWLSALVESGVVGVVVLAMWMVSLGRATARVGRVERSMLLALGTFVLLLATFQSGLANATPLFLTIIVIGLVSVPTGQAAALPATSTPASGPKSLIGADDPSRFGIRP